MLAPPDHPAGRSQPSNSITATSNIALTSQNSQQIDNPSSFQPTASLHPNQQRSQSFTAHLHSPALEYLLLPADSSDDDPALKEDQQPSQNEGSITAPPVTNYTPPSVQPPLPSPTTTTPIQILQCQQQQQNEHSIPESMGHESIGDFAYIGTFPENDATNSSYELQQLPYPNSFQQLQEVQHLNRAFSPQSSVPCQLQQHQQQQNHHHQQQQQCQQPQHYQQHLHQLLLLLQQRQASYPPPPIMHSRAYSEPVVHLYSEPELVDTRVNENNAAAVFSTSVGRSLSYSSSASSSPSSPTKPTLRLHRRNRMYWIGGAVVITLIVAVIALVVIMKEGDDSNDNKNNDSDTHSSGNHHSALQPPSIYTTLQPLPTFPARPSPTRGPPSPVDGSQVSPPPLPSFPAKNKPCPLFLCIDYLEAYTEACSQDGAYRTCVAPCLSENGVDVTCDVGCRDVNQCFIQGIDNQWTCQTHCGFT